MLIQGNESMPVAVSNLHISWILLPLLILIRMLAVVGASHASQADLKECVNQSEPLTGLAGFNLNTFACSYYISYCVDNSKWVNTLHANRLEPT